VALPARQPVHSLRKKFTFLAPATPEQPAAQDFSIPKDYCLKFGDDYAYTSLKNILC
jgi:hypothetical protein